MYLRTHVASTKPTSSGRSYSFTLFLEHLLIHELLAFSFVALLEVWPVFQNSIFAEDVSVFITIRSRQSGGRCVDGLLCDSEGGVEVLVLLASVKRGSVFSSISHHQQARSREVVEV